MREKERERESERVCEREREWEREGESVCERERESGRERERACVRERARALECGGRQTARASKLERRGIGHVPYLETPTWEDSRCPLLEHGR